MRKCIVTRSFVLVFQQRLLALVLRRQGNGIHSRTCDRRSTAMNSCGRGSLTGFLCLFVFILTSLCHLQICSNRSVSLKLMQSFNLIYSDAMIVCLFLYHLIWYSSWHGTLYSVDGRLTPTFGIDGNCYLILSMCLLVFAAPTSMLNHSDHWCD